MLTAPPMKPGRYFISHSYRDAAVRDELIKQLPEGLSPFVFPSITDPKKLVSNELIQGILAQDGMIVIEEGESAKSFWVAFERDYALRAGKPVYAFRPSRNELSELKQKPLDLNICPLHYRQDLRLAHKPLNLLKQRYFDFVSIMEWVNNPFIEMETIVANRGGYVLFFWSKTFAEPLIPSERKQMGEYLAPPPDSLLYKHLMFALLDEAPLPPWYVAALNQNKMKDSNIYSVQLYRDEERNELQRVDDLIVRLYWLIFRNQFPELVYE